MVDLQKLLWVTLNALLVTNAGCGHSMWTRMHVQTLQPPIAEVPCMPERDCEAPAPVFGRMSLFCRARQRHFALSAWTCPCTCTAQLVASTCTPLQCLLIVDINIMNQAVYSCRCIYGTN